jgi:hypothetical protein
LRGILHWRIVADKDYNTAIALGLIPGVTRIAQLGYVVVATTGSVPVDIASTPVALPGSAGVSLEAVSSSASDAAGGAGMQSLVVGGVNPDYQLIRPITVALNGTTAVAIPDSAIGKWLRVTSARGSMTIPNASATQTNVGTITIRDAGGGTTRAVILPGKGIAQSSLYTVPVGHMLIIKAIEFQILSSAGGGITRGADAQLIFRNSNGFFTGARNLSCTDTGAATIDSELFIPVLARQDFWMRCTYTSANTMAVTGSYEGHLHQLQ